MTIARDVRLTLTAAEVLLVLRGLVEYVSVEQDRGREAEETADQYAEDRREAARAWRAAAAADSLRVRILHERDRSEKRARKAAETLRRVKARDTRA